MTTYEWTEGSVAEAVLRLRQLLVEGDPAWWPDERSEAVSLLDFLVADERLKRLALYRLVRSVEREHRPNLPKSENVRIALALARSALGEKADE